MEYGTGTEVSIRNWVASRPHYPYTLSVEETRALGLLVQEATIDCIEVPEGCFYYTIDLKPIEPVESLSLRAIGLRECGDIP